MEVEDAEVRCGSGLLLGKFPQSFGFYMDTLPLRVCRINAHVCRNQPDKKKRKSKAASGLTHTWDSIQSMQEREKEGERRKHMGIIRYAT